MQNEKSRNENLKIYKIDPGKLVDSFSPRDGPALGWDHFNPHPTPPHHHFVPGLSRTPLLFIPRYLANICSKKNGKRKFEKWKSENIKNRSWKVSWFVFSQRWTSTSLRSFQPPPHPTPPPFCSGSLQDTFTIYSSISHQHISKKNAKQ